MMESTMNDDEIRFSKSLSATNDPGPRPPNQSVEKPTSVRRATLEEFEAILEDAKAKVLEDSSVGLTKNEKGGFSIVVNVPMTVYNLPVIVKQVGEVKKL
jgi:hypothetical protein